VRAAQLSLAKRSAPALGLGTAKKWNREIRWPTAGRNTGKCRCRCHLHDCRRSGIRTTTPLPPPAGEQQRCPLISIPALPLPTRIILARSLVPGHFSPKLFSRRFPLPRCRSKAVLLFVFPRFHCNNSFRRRSRCSSQRNFESAKSALAAATSPQPNAYNEAIALGSADRQSSGPNSASRSHARARRSSKIRSQRSGYWLSMLP